MCPRCEKPIKVGDKIRHDADFDRYVHTGCKPKPDPLEKGRPDAGLVIRKITADHQPQVCPDCHLEHAGACW
jgi:hypothetical protein